MDFNFKLTTLAENDLNALAEYLVVNIDKQYANTITAKIKAKIKGICKEPKLYQVMTDENYARKQIRRVSIDRYLIYYKIDENEQLIYIVRIRSDRQNNKNIKI